MFSPLPLGVMKVRDRSMEPSFKEGDYVFVYQMMKSVKNGDVIVLRHPSGRFNIIKRVKSQDRDSVFVIGDNQKLSEDSRKFGKVDKRYIIGKVVLKV